MLLLKHWCHSTDIGRGYRKLFYFYFYEFHIIFVHEDLYRTTICTLLERHVIVIGLFTYVE